ncbi:MAG: hypothetical protein JOZ16_02280 [Methylobacteriaceae bacterium]|nr:hypothetical protein [Methylobacteriaceae bacterium]
MPTDLPPDYKPTPKPDTEPADPNAPGSVPTPPGKDMPGHVADVPQPGPGVGAPGPGPDVIDPPGWREPPIVPGGDPIGVPTPAGTPSF